MITHPVALLHPCQILTTTHAESRIQAVIDLYNNREYLSSVLPSDKRRLTNVAFAALCECVEVAEASLVKICMYFDDEVLQTVVAIITCAHHQRELYAESLGDEASTRYIIPLGVMNDMSVYLNSVIKKLLHVLKWIETGEGMPSIYAANAAIREMHLSLRRFVCQQECHPDDDALSDAATANTSISSEPGSSTLPSPILPACNKLCSPFFGLETWPKNNSHWYRTELNNLPDRELRDRNWVPIATPLERLAEHLAPQRPEPHIPLSPLQRFCASREPIDVGKWLSLSSPSRFSPATDTGYASLSVSQRCRSLGGYTSDADSTAANPSSPSSSSTRKRRQRVEDLPSHFSSSGELDGQVSRPRKRARHHSSFTHVVPQRKRAVQRSMSMPTASSTTCVSSGGARGQDDMDVDESDSDSRITGYSNDISNATLAGLDQGDATSSKDDMDALTSAPWWNEEVAAADSSVDDHLPRPSRWLRVLWKLFYWQK